MPTAEFDRECSSECPPATIQRKGWRPPCGAVGRRERKTPALEAGVFVEFLARVAPCVREGSAPIAAAGTTTPAAAIAATAVPTATATATAVPAATATAGPVALLLLRARLVHGHRPAAE